MLDNFTRLGLATSGTESIELMVPKKSRNLRTSAIYRGVVCRRRFSRLRYIISHNRNEFNYYSIQLEIYKAGRDLVDVTSIGPFSDLLRKFAQISNFPSVHLHIFYQP